jgi:integrase
MHTYPRGVDASKILTRRELAVALADLASKAPRSRNTRMNLILVRLACCCGLRVSEIAGLRLSRQL